MSKKKVFTFLIVLGLIFSLAGCAGMKTDNEKIVEIRDALCESGENSASSRLDNEILPLVEAWNKAIKGTDAPTIDVSYLKQLLGQSCNQAEAIVASTKILLDRNPSADLGSQLDLIEGVQDGFDEYVDLQKKDFEDANAALEVYKTATSVQDASTYDTYQQCKNDILSQNWKSAKDYCSRVIKNAPTPVPAAQAVTTPGGGH